jgi:hypothetical protein
MSVLSKMRKLPVNSDRKIWISAEKNTNQPTNTYTNIFHRLCIAFFDQFLIQSQGPLNLYYSVDSQFPISSWRKETMFKTYVYVFQWKLWKVCTLGYSSLDCFLVRGQVGKSEWITRWRVAFIFLHCLRSNGVFKNDQSRSASDT